MDPAPHARKLLQQLELSSVSTPLRLDLVSGETLALVGTDTARILRAASRMTHMSEDTTLRVALFDANAALSPSGSTVEQNVFLGLPANHQNASAIVAHWLHVFGLSAVCTLAPASLGIEAQRRIGLARALVSAPHVLLLIDPFRGCDPDERRRLGEALRRLQSQSGMGIVLAGQHPTDARALADRVLVLRAGRLIQEGETVSVYERPNSAFAACALGEVNLLPGTFDRVEDDTALVTLADGTQVEAIVADAVLGPCVIAIRPERIAVASVDKDDMGEGAVAARVVSRVHYGDHIRLTLIAGGAPVVVRRPPGKLLAVGSEVSIAWQTPHAYACQPPPPRNTPAENTS
jgi:ABC-type Fe3+/spermidine/putrescine transport system ATPase subunit